VFAGSTPLNRATDLTMEASPVFLKLRAVAFSCITMLSLTWIVLLCVIIFYRWDISDHLERSLILVILLANTITVIALPVLILLQFRPWLDAARLAFLLVAHIGTAVAFTTWNATFTCPEQTGDQAGECKLINMYILLANWVNPAFLISYSVGLALMVHRRSRRSAMALLKLRIEEDEEAIIGRGSILPMMNPDVAEKRSPTDIFPADLTRIHSHGLEQGDAATGRGSRTSRLSKPTPALYF